MTPEGKNTAYLKKAVQKLGGICRKCHWEGRVGAPDWLIMINGEHYFLELKAPGEVPRKTQEVEASCMRQYGGCQVYYADNPQVIESILNGAIYEYIGNGKYRNRCKDILLTQQQGIIGEWYAINANGELVRISYGL